MLLRFNVKNFLSFKDVTEFSMFPGAVRIKENHLIKSRKTNILKFAAIYGANAAGKSNLVKAMNYSKNIILHGVAEILDNKFFKLDCDYKNLDSTFEYEFEIDGNYYAYGFNILISKREITGEWLYDISSSDEKVIFERDLINKKFNHGITFRKELNKLRFKVYSEDIKYNNKLLFLSELNRNKEDLYKYDNEFKVFKNVYCWFLKFLDINFPDAPITNFQYLLGNNSDFNSNITKILNMFGTGITDFKLIDSTIDDIKNQIPKAILEDIKLDLTNNEMKNVNLRTNNAFHNITLDDNENLKIRTIAFTHGKDTCDFYLFEESDGTRRLMDLIEVLINTRNKVYIIDEIDRSLHPNLTYKFIELFLEIVKDRNVQLIVTTHEDRVLDLDLLRRDEIWFAEKLSQGNTILYSLENFKPRFDTKTCKAYLEGRYGAIPNFKNLDLEIFRD